MQCCIPAWCGWWDASVPPLPPQKHLFTGSYLGGHTKIQPVIQVHTHTTASSVNERQEGSFLWSSSRVYCSNTPKGSRDKRQRSMKCPELSMGSGANGLRAHGQCKGQQPIENMRADSDTKTNGKTRKGEPSRTGTYMNNSGGQGQQDNGKSKTEVN